MKEAQPENEMHVGGGYLAQPKHKPMVIPRDFLAQFINVDVSTVGSVIQFANNYSFGGYLFPDKNDSIIDKFVKIQTKHRAIIEKLLRTGSINYADILLINGDLESTHPKISLRGKVNELFNIEEGFTVYTLESFEDEKSEYKVQRIGSFDVDEKASHIKVTIEKPANSKTQWYYRRIQDGVTKIQDIYPSEKWDDARDYMKSIILTDGKMKIDDVGRPVSIELNYRLGKTDFKKEEISAVWSPATGESFVAKRIWDYLNSEYLGTKFKQCKICGDMHTGRSQDYCTKEECFKEWDSRRKLIKKT